MWPFNKGTFQFHWNYFKISFNTSAVKLLIGMFLIVCFDRMTVSRFWGKLSCVSTVVSPWWTVRKTFPRNLILIEVGTIPWMLTRDQGYLCATTMCQFTIHLLNNTKNPILSQIEIEQHTMMMILFLFKCIEILTVTWIKTAFDWNVLFTSYKPGRTLRHTPLSLCALLELYLFWLLQVDKTASAQHGFLCSTAGGIMVISSQDGQGV